MNLYKSWYIGAVWVWAAVDMNVFVAQATTYQGSIRWRRWRPGTSCWDNSTWDLWWWWRRWRRFSHTAGHRRTCSYYCRGRVWLGTVRGRIRCDDWWCHLHTQMWWLMMSLTHTGVMTDDVTYTHRCDDWWRHLHTQVWWLMTSLTHTDVMTDDVTYTHRCDDWWCHLHTQVWWLMMSLTHTGVMTDDVTYTHRCDDWWCHLHTQVWWLMTSLTHTGTCWQWPDVGCWQLPSMSLSPELLPQRPSYMLW